jgi:formylglycine-generating enzyme required for sulfatase activity
VSGRIVFLSYARKDAALVEELRDHLQPLEDGGEIRVWMDTQVEGGEAWEARIRARLAEAVVVVAFVTPRFLASKWCKEESQFAREAGKAILPVHVSDFSRRADVFKDLQYVPDLSRPVMAWGNDKHHRDKPWSMVVDALGDVLERVEREVEAEKAREAAARDAAAREAEAREAAARKAREDAAREAAAREAVRKAREAAAREAAARRAQWTALVPPLVHLSAGTFVMGSPEGMGEPREHPAHEVRLTRPFAMGVTPITQAQWKAVVTAAQAAPWAKEEPGLSELNPAPSHFQAGPEAPNRPVEQVSWLDAVSWCNALSRLVGCRPAYRRADAEVTLDPEGTGFRLPTEAEWEYACRAGTRTRWSHGDNEAGLAAVAWYDKNAQNTTHPVGSKRANPWGLHDLHGNVWEWCWDWFDVSFYASSPPVDPKGPPPGKHRVLRGGGGGNTANWCRSAYRNRRHPDVRNGNWGFRVVVLSPPPELLGGRP